MREIKSKLMCASACHAVLSVCLPHFANFEGKGPHHWIWLQSSILPDLPTKRKGNKEPALYRFIKQFDPGPLCPKQQTAFFGPTEFQTLSTKEFGLSTTSSRSRRRGGETLEKWLQKKNSRELTYPTLGKGNHLQNWLLRGYVGSQEGTFQGFLLLALHNVHSHNSCNLDTKILESSRRRLRTDWAFGAGLWETDLEKRDDSVCIGDYHAWM